MNTLSLSPLPTVRKEEASDSFLMEREGFVDEAVVTALVAGGSLPRYAPVSSDLALSADDMDFAGWSIAPALPPRVSEKDSPEMEAFSGVDIRESAPLPVIDDREPGLGQSHRGGHRWWLAGLAGILCTLLGSVLFLSLSERPNVRLNDASQSPSPAASATSMIAPANTAPAPVFAAPVSSNTALNR